MKNCYKVKIKPTNGNKFYYINRTPSIKYDFQGQLIPVTDEQAAELNLPPGVDEYNYQHQYFEPTITGVPVITQLWQQWCEYDYTNCTIGGDEFLLTDETLKVYKVSPKAALYLLINMFYHGEKDLNYKANGENFHYDFNKKCMYSNVSIFNLSIDNDTVKFNGKIFAYDKTRYPQFPIPGKTYPRKPNFDLEHVWIAEEREYISNNYYVFSLSDIGKYYEYKTYKISNQSLVLWKTNNLNLQETKDLSYRRQESPLYPTKEYIHYSYVPSIRNQVDNNYQYVFIRNKTWKTAAYYIEGNYFYNNKICDWSFEKEQLSYTKKSNIIANSCTKTNVYGWNNNISHNIFNLSVIPFATKAKIKFDLTRSDYSQIRIYEYKTTTTTTDVLIRTYEEPYKELDENGEEIWKVRTVYVYGKKTTTTVLSNKTFATITQKKLNHDILINGLTSNKSYQLKIIISGNEPNSSYFEDLNVKPQLQNFYFTTEPYSAFPKAVIVQDNLYYSGCTCHIETQNNSKYTSEIIFNNYTKKIGENSYFCSFGSHKYTKKYYYQNTLVYSETVNFYANSIYPIKIINLGKRTKNKIENFQWSFINLSQNLTNISYNIKIDGSIVKTEELNTIPQENKIFHIVITHSILKDIKVLHYNYSFMQKLMNFSRKEI